MSERRWLRWPAVVLVGIATAVPRLIQLGHPAVAYFDETYYANDACLYALGEGGICGNEPEISVVHPPLGKELIALGIRLFGYEAWAWRIVPAVAGISTVWLVYLVGRRLLRSEGAALLAAGFLAIDFLHIVQSRVAMLDVFLPLFGFASLLCALVYRDRMDRGANRSRPSPGSYLWIVGAGLFAGLAMNVKWSGAFFLIVLVPLLLGVRRRGAHAVRASTRSAAIVLITAAVAYTAAFAARLPEQNPVCPELGGPWGERFVEQHLCMAAFHRSLQAAHFYQSPAWSWPLLKRPIAYYFCAGADCRPEVPSHQVEEVVAIGHPLLWISSLAAVVIFVLRSLRRKQIGSGGILAAWGFVAMFLPWVVIDAASTRDAIFLFYLLPALPFGYIALAALTKEVSTESGPGQAAAGLFVVAAAAMLLFYLPLLTARPLPVEEWHRRVAPFSECRGPGIAVFTPNPPPRTGDSGLNKSSGKEPPGGWCWI